MENEKEGLDIGQIINTILTIILILLIAFAIYQRFFETMKCKDFCVNKLKTVPITCRYSDGTKEVQNYNPDWAGIFKEGINGTGK